MRRSTTVLYHVVHESRWETRPAHTKKLGTATVAGFCGLREFLENDGAALRSLAASPYRPAQSVQGLAPPGIAEPAPSNWHRIPAGRRSGAEVPRVGIVSPHSPLIASFLSATAFSKDKMASLPQPEPPKNPLLSNDGGFNGAAPETSWMGGVKGPGGIGEMIQGADRGFFDSLALWVLQVCMTRLQRCRPRAASLRQTQSSSHHWARLRSPRVVSPRR